MPRLARLDAPGVLHHIMIRGIERRKIFLNNRDPEDFLQRISKLLPETKTACYTWVFIPHHAHFFRELICMQRRIPSERAPSDYIPLNKDGQIFFEIWYQNVI